MVSILFFENSPYGSKPVYINRIHKNVHLFYLDHAETRRGRASVNTVWTPAKSTFAGDYVLAVCSKLIARTNNQVSKFYWLKS